MAIRHIQGIKIAIKSKFSWGWWEKMKAKYSIRDVAREMKTMSDMAAVFQDRSKANNTNKIAIALERCMKASLDGEGDLSKIEEVATSFEYESLQFLEEVHDELRKVLKTAKGMPIEGQLRAFVDKYKQILTSIKPQLSEQAQILRRESIKRYMIKDVMMLQAYILKFMQYRRMVNSLRRGELRTEHEEHAIVADFHKMLKTKKPEEIIPKLMSSLGKFDEALKTVVSDTFHIIQMTGILKNEIKAYANKAGDGLRQMIAANAISGDKAKAIQKIIADFEQKCNQDVDKQYAVARQLLHEAYETEI
jgi:hypothetical protein